MTRPRRALLLAACCWAVSAAAGAADHEFELELYKTRLQHEIAFRAAAIEVAWGAEPLCDTTTEVEPFVLWSVHELRRKLSDADLALLERATGMDEKWRVAWLDESVPDEIRLGDVVVAIDGLPLPVGGSTHFELGAVFAGRSIVSYDDQGFWQVLLKARERASEGEPLVLTLAGGRRVTVPTQTGCAGAVTASAFDADPDAFWRQGHERAKIPANAMLEARSRDEYRWLAAFGTYFQASTAAIGAAEKSEGRSSAFLVGKILTLALPGSGVLLSAVQAQADRALAVDSIVGSADLFADEVVAALGGDPAAGLALNQRLQAQNSKAEAVLMNDFRRSNAVEHVRRLHELQALQDKAQADSDAADRSAQDPPAAASAR